MAMSTINVLFVFCTLWHLRHGYFTNFLEVPPISCPDYFRYFQQDDNYMGILMIPAIPIGYGVITIEIQLSQRGSIKENYNARLIFHPDTQTVNYNLKNGIPISYLVYFPTPHQLPKMTRISVNGAEICSNFEYAAPSTLLTIQSNVLMAANGMTTYPLIVQTVEREESDALKGKETSLPLLPTNLTTDCGQANGNILIYGGTNIARGQYPWLTALYRKSNEGGAFQCGGSLISSRTVITAAHCTETYAIINGVPATVKLRADQMYLGLGQRNIFQQEIGAIAKNIRVILNHPEYNNRPDADMALLQLETSVRFSENIRPVCIWDESSDESLIVNEVATATGWGADQFGRAVTDLPKTGDVVIVTRNICRSHSNYYRSHVSDRSICAGNRDGTGPCHGDSGGPLMLLRGGRWMLRGIVSYGPSHDQQCNLGDYVIYCDVAKHISWIKANMWN